jgi:type I restriction enzyme, S subunit
MPSEKSSIDPRRHPDQEFDLFSIPAFDAGMPEVVRGREIGSSKQTLLAGDVLLSKIVPHIRRACVVPPGAQRPMIGSSEWIIFRSERFDPGYLRHALVSDQVHRAFMQTVAGVGGSLLRARPAHVAEIEIPLPPIEEQRRIAAVLDAADALRAKRRQALARLDTLTQAIFIDMFGDPGSNSKGYPMCDLDEIADQVTDGEHATPPRTSEGVRLLSARNVRDGFFDMTKVDHVSEHTYERLRKRCDPQAGDLLISCSGSIGRVAQVDGSEPLALVRSVALVRPMASRVESGFLEAYLQTPAMRRLMVQRANASSQANLFQNQIRRLPVLLPPRTEQGLLIQRLGAMKEVALRLARSSAQLDALFASLQQRAFRGEL